MFNFQRFLKYDYQRFVIVFSIYLEANVIEDLRIRQPFYYYKRHPVIIVKKAEHTRCFGSGKLGFSYMSRYSPGIGSELSTLYSWLQAMLGCSKLYISHIHLPHHLDIISLCFRLHHG